MEKGKIILNTLFPKLCLNCGKEEDYLCEDCKSCLDISENIFCLCDNPKIIKEPGKCNSCQNKNLDGLFFAVPYQNKIAKKLVDQFENEPYIKSISGTLANVISDHFQLIDKLNFWKDKFLLPVEVEEKNIKEIGYDPNKELAQELSKTFKVKLIKKRFKDKKIVLIKTIYDNKSELDELARTLKNKGSKEVWATSFARKS